MIFYFVKIFQLLLMPPALMIIIMLLGLLLMRKSQRYGKILIISGMVLLLASSLPIIIKPLIISMESTPALSLKNLKMTDASAIVVLGGGSYLNAPEYEGDTVSTGTLERIRYAAYLQRQTNLPVLVTGGRVFDYIKVSEASLMKKVLQNAFHATVKWEEEQSRNTWENAQYSYKMLEQQKINKIILVTHAMHMPRSILSFEAAGFDVTPAPLAFHSKSTGFSASLLVPSAGTMYTLSHFMHETIGILWYRLHYM